jgi:hypothetical protein
MRILRGERPYGVKDDAPHVRMDDLVWEILGIGVAAVES